MLQTVFALSGVAPCTPTNHLPMKTQQTLNLGDALQSQGPRSTVQVLAEDGSGLSPAIAIARTNPPDILSIIALRKLNLSEPWSSCGWKRMDPDGLIVRVAQEVILKSGPRKGKKVWRGEEREVFASYAEITATELAWEKEHDTCHQCGGDGQMWAGWNHETGTRYRECDVCVGSGKPAKTSHQ